MTLRAPGALHLRVARPTLDLAAAERFWTDGAGLEVLWRSGPDDDHALVMVGSPDAAWHLELVGGDLRPTPTEEDLLVLYLDGPLDPARLDRLLAAGGRRVVSRNPYWEQWGATVEDPDGYRLVLSTRSWVNAAGA